MIVNFDLIGEYMAYDFSKHCGNETREKKEKSPGPVL